MLNSTFNFTTGLLGTGFYQSTNFHILPIIQADQCQKDRWYIFDHTELAVLAKNAVNTHGNDTRAVIDTIVSELKSQHPSYAIASQEEWIFNNAGGAMGAMYLIHASITEYLIVFGTPLGTEGHTGRHTADDYFHIRMLPILCSPLLLAEIFSCA